MFKNYKDCRLNLFDDNFESNYWINYIVLKNNDDIKKLSLIKSLKKNSIYTQAPWFPLHLQKIFKNEQKMNMETTEKVYKKILLLPSGTNAIEILKNEK